MHLGHVVPACCGSRSVPQQVCHRLFAWLQEILAHNFVLFSLLVPFDCPVVPVSPSLQSELRIDIAELLLEPDGVPHIRLGVEAEEEPGG